MATYVPIDELGIYILSSDVTTYEDAVAAATNPEESEAAGATYQDLADGHWGTVK